ncbi:helix-turn-helix domain-containing protein [Wielerella bovis]|uniref:helix-turn-helix domain-containing protein n=1 Tax=Wielerella bovis TaxID=2917790 RepID=UPI0020191A3E|nr:helix-turn-helix domain-containing protein [Wielerella bovis]ULJ65630.1 DUF4115 domain-containing protein [Wielerella bovis]ULJ66326.1 DUF4115 domain-containing protein [Wielerella bovis]
MKPTEQTPNIIHSAAELGNELRLQREKKNLSIGEVSERLKLPARQIEALESGQYENLPEPVFVRGFLRSYGRFLDLDENVLDRALEHIAPPSAGTKHTHLGHHTDLNFSNTKRKKPFPTWILGLLAIGAIGYGVYAWQNKSNKDNAEQEANNSILTNVIASSPAASALNNSNVIVKPMTASDTQTETASAPPTSGNPLLQTGVAGELVINTRYRTMLTVTNANGEILINQIVPARSEHRFKDGAPFEVRLGYASGSTATFGGEEIDVQAARKGGKTAVFTAGGTTAQ